MLEVQGLDCRWELRISIFRFRMSPALILCGGSERRSGQINFVVRWWQQNWWLGRAAGECETSALRAKVTLGRLKKKTIFVVLQTRLWYIYINCHFHLSQKEKQAKKNTNKKHHCVIRFFGQVTTWFSGPLFLPQELHGTGWRESLETRWTTSIFSPRVG